MSKKHDGPGISVMEEMIGTKYPYVNLRQDHLNPFFSSVKRAIAPYNPFA